MAMRAFVFAGQGAQFVGMGKDLADSYTECRDLFARADAALGRGLSEICFTGPAEALTRTDNCQPAIFAVSAACYAALKHERPDLAFAGAAGLSLGEWTALYAAGVLNFEDTLKILEARGRFMQDTCNAAEGAMLSVIGLSTDAVRALCEGSGAEMANLNSAQQTVLSGTSAAIAKAETLAKAAGAKMAVRLQVAGAYHSSLMKPAAERLAEFLASVKFHAPAMPVVANVTGAPHGSPDSIREAMTRQVTSPVLWQKSIEWFQANGVTEYVECGPGKVLSGLIKRIDRAANTLNVQDVETLKATAAALKG